MRFLVTFYGSDECLRSVHFGAVGVSDGMGIWFGNLGCLSIDLRYSVAEDRIGLDWIG